MLPNYFTIPDWNEILVDWFVLRKGVILDENPNIDILSNSICVISNLQFLNS